MDLDTVEVAALAGHPSEIDGYRVVGFLGRGGMGYVYRVVPQGSKEELALKLLHGMVAVSDLDRLRFEREFKVASQLDHPSLVGVHNFGFTQQQPYYTMELVRGVSFRQYVDGPAASAPDKIASLQRLGQVGKQLLEVLEYIHTQGIVHRDLKPENVLVGADGLPRLLDFGLARGRELSTQLTDPGMVIGTIHYMSPEQVSGSGELDGRSDLYSFGVMLFEILTGRLPFEAKDIVNVIYQILYHEPPSLFELAGPLPAGLEALMKKLLAKEASDRFTSAAQVLTHWEKVFEDASEPVVPSIEMELSIEATVEMTQPEIPEALFAPRFVGRDAEMARLTEHYEKLKAGRGSFLSFEGVSGVGKSRLLQESTALARSTGYPIVWGHGQEIEAFPFQHWVRALRWAVGKGLAPDVEPYRRVLSLILPELSPSESKAQLDRSDPLHKFHLFEGMLRLLRHAASGMPASGDRRARSQPPQGGERRAGAGGAVILLDDLQWADAASLEFLHYMVRAMETEEDSAAPHLLLLASINTEDLEDRPALGKTLSQMERLKIVRRIALEPLTLEHTRHMASSMLGSGSIEQETAERLHHETEGNPMFVSEMLKSLVAEGRMRFAAGSWSLESIGVLRASSGGGRVPFTVREAVQRRLAGISSDDLQIARLGAAIGRIFSFGILQKAAGIPGDELLERVVNLTRRKVIHELSHESYAFFNQPIVEVILDAIPLAERRQLHGRVALALEQSEDITRHAADLAYHYQLSGDPKMAVIHLIGAAEAHTRAFAYLEAARFYKEALKLPEELAMLPRNSLKESLADVTYGAGLSEDALEQYTWLVKNVEERLAQARLLRKLGTCWERLGNYPQAYECLLRALTLMGIRLSGDHWIAKVGLARLALAFSFPSIWAQPYKKNREKTLEIHHLLRKLAHVLVALMPTGWKRHNLEVACLQQAVAAALGEIEGTSQAGLLVGYVYMFRKNYKAARKYLSSSVARARKSQSMEFRSSTLRDAGYLMFMGGDTEGGISATKEAVEVAASTGSVHLLPQARCMLAAMYRSRGLLHLSEEQALLAHEAAELTMSRPDQAMAHANLAQARIIQGKTEQARHHLELAEKFRGGYPMPIQEMLAAVARCGVEYGEGKLESSVKSAQVARELTKTVPALTFYSAETYCVEAAALAEIAKDDPSRRVQAFQATETLIEQAQGIFPHLVAVGRRLQAQLLLAEGKIPEACKVLDDDLKELEAIDNPLEQGLAHQVYSEVLRHTDPATSEVHRAKANDYLISIGAKPFVERFEKGVSQDAPASP